MMSPLFTGHSKLTQSQPLPELPFLMGTTPSDRLNRGLECLQLHPAGSNSRRLPPQLCSVSGASLQVHVVKVPSSGALSEAGGPSEKSSGTRD